MSDVIPALFETAFGLALSVVSGSRASLCNPARGFASLSVAGKVHVRRGVKIRPGPSVFKAVLFPTSDI